MSSPLLCTRVITVDSAAIAGVWDNVFFVSTTSLMFAMLGWKLVRPSAVVYASTTVASCATSSTERTSVAFSPSRARRRGEPATCLNDPVARCERRAWAMTAARGAYNSCATKTSRRPRLPRTETINPRSAGSFTPAT